MRVLFVLNSSDFFCSHFFELARALQLKKVEVIVACADDMRKLEIENAGFSFELISLSRKGRNPLRELGAFFNIFSLVRRLSPDILHLFTIKPVLYGGLICDSFLLKKKPITIASITGLGSSYLRSGMLGRVVWKMIEILYKKTLRKPNVSVVFENQDDLDFFVGKGLSLRGNSYKINGAGVDIEKFSPCVEKRDVFTVVLVARLLKDKGIREYIEAGRLLKESNIRVCLVLAGSVDEGNPSSMSKQEIEEADRRGYVEYQGFRADVYNLYKSSHIACLPSYREGLPKSLIEGAASGLGILTTDVPGCRQMVFDGKNGVLVPPKDAVALANAIEYMVDNPKDVEEMGRFSRDASVSLFGYNIIFNAFFTLYDLN
jgi:glycosyltransferase involved in cell wall biosynthesis